MVQYSVSKEELLLLQATVLVNAEMLDAHNSAAAAAASAAATTSAVTATVTMPSTSSVGVDQKNISPQQLAMGGTLITKRGSQEDNMNPYV
ncbi:hypothetical protein C0Q70_13524 [Pomacea canaliculata]|uniref:Uncharacterized protein n=1 Tax=Pomacea canaliculata TaxID=400727 RepID=A0A2T7NXE3_POMCA|nr:hypothetical protein C0Q70_13524 [Pomacea canaliculata]